PKTKALLGSAYSGIMGPLVNLLVMPSERLFGNPHTLHLRFVGNGGLRRITLYPHGDPADLETLAKSERLRLLIANGGLQSAKPHPTELSAAEIDRVRGAPRQKYSTPTECDDANGWWEFGTPQRVNRLTNSGQALYVEYMDADWIAA